jgi:hypothetical protein
MLGTGVGMNAVQIMALVVLGVLYLLFCGYWWRGGGGLSGVRLRRDDDDA